MPGRQCSGGLYRPPTAPGEMWQEIFQLVTHSGHPHQYSQAERKWQIWPYLRHMLVIFSVAVKLLLFWFKMWHYHNSLDTELLSSATAEACWCVAVHATSSVKLMCPVFHYCATTLLNDNKIHWHNFIQNLYLIFWVTVKNFMQSVERNCFWKSHFLSISDCTH